VLTKVEVPRQLAGPLPRGAIVGRVVILSDGKPIASVPLVLAKALPAVSQLTKAVAFLTRGSTLFVLVVLLAAAGGTVMFWRQRTRALAGGTRR
jgi:hypothetical protein